MEKKSGFKKTLSIVLNTIGWIFVIFAVAITILVFASQNEDGVPNINGKCVINILTASMEPTLNTGDIIIGQALTSDEKQHCEEGDIITFYSDLNGDGINEINTHRIVGINKDSNGNNLSYITKGDNPQTNMVEDKDPVVCALVICKYTGYRLASVGTFLNFLQTQMGFFVVIVLPLIVIFLYELIKFVLTVKEVKNAKAKGADGTLSADEEALIKQKAVEEYIKQQAIEEYKKQLAAQATVQAEPSAPKTPAENPDSTVNSSTEQQ